MLQDIGWRSTDPCPHCFSQSMTVDTPFSGIESLLPPRGTSYKSLHCQPTPTNVAALAPFCKAAAQRIPSALQSENEILSGLLPCIDSPEIKHLELKHILQSLLTSNPTEYLTSIDSKCRLPKNARSAEHSTQRTKNLIPEEAMA